MATVASRAPEVGLGMAVKGGEYFVGAGLSKTELFLKKALKVDANKPETIAEALKVGASTGVTSSRIAELDTRNKIMGSNEIDPVKGTKKRSPEEKNQFDKADKGKEIVENFRNYDSLSPADQLTLQNRVISVIKARPHGATTVTTTAEADKFIKDNYKRLSTFSDKEIIRILEDPQDPVTASEAVLQANLELNEADFAQTTAKEALDSATEHRDKLKNELTQLTTDPPPASSTGERLQTLKGQETGRLSNITSQESIIRAMETERSNAIQSLSSLHERYGSKTPIRDRYGNVTSVVTSDPEIRAEIVRLEQKLLDYNNSATGLPKEYEKLTKLQMEQKEYESLLKRKSELPAEIAKAGQDVLLFTKDKTNAAAALKKSKEALYSANQTRVTTELRYSESVSHIFDEAINKIIDENIDAVVPNLAKGLDFEARLRVAEMEERLGKRYQEKIRWWPNVHAPGLHKLSITEKIIWKKKLIREDMENMVNGNDGSFDTFIITNNLVDGYDAIPATDPERAQIRALVATRMVDTNFKVNHRIPEDGQLFELAKKGWVDELHVLNLRNNPEYVAQLQQKFPEEEIKEDNPVLTAKVRSNIVLDGSLILLMFGLSAAGKENK